MRMKKSTAGLMALITAGAICVSANPVSAFVSKSEPRGVYGILTGRQGGLSDDDYNMMCSITLETSVTTTDDDVCTLVEYLMENNTTGVQIGAVQSAIAYENYLSVKCNLDDYGYYEITDDIAVFSAHYGSCIGECEALYLSRAY